MEDLYQFDVFFSYKRDPRSQEWVSRVKDCLDYWLRQEVGRSRIFFDAQSIDVGFPWPEAIRDALLSSRCMVGIWSAEYFRSGWCLTEWRSFQRREIETKIDGLILPLKYHDGESFPEDARRMKYRDISRFASIMSSFWATSRAVELEDEIRQFAVDLARALERAPKFGSFPLQLEVDIDFGPNDIFHPRLGSNGLRK
jgi:hypothetical protein